MLRSLLVGVNGSEWSQAACEIGTAWAAELKIPLTCLGVVDLLSLTYLEPVPLGAGELATACDVGLIAVEQEKIKAALQRAGELAERSGIECRLLNREGNPATLLGEEAQRHDLIILGRRGHPKVGCSSTPSDTLVEILRHTPRPIVLAAQTIPKASNVVIAYDGSVQAARTLQSFVSSGLYYGHPLHLVGISNSADAMNQILGRAVDFLGAHCLKAETHVLPVGAGVGESLIDFARRVPAGLMIIGTYGQPWYKELLFGSVTKSVLAQFPVPMFLNH
jgi:nucleotide-binding universal stress UspA family protein